MEGALLCLFFALAACGSEKATEASASTAPLVPFTGELTSERILSAKDVVRPLEPWSEAIVALEAKLGKPTRIKGEKYGWAVMDGDACTYFEVEKSTEGELFEGGHKTDAVVGMVLRPMRVEKDGALLNYADCLSIAGAVKEAPEDPDAPGPPAGGTVPAATFVESAVKARSKWKGQRVRVEGITGTVTTSVMTSGDTKIESVQVRILPAKDDAEKGVGCTLRAGATAPDQASGSLVVAEGRVAIREFVRGTGEPGMEASLEDCVLDFAGAP